MLSVQHALSPALEAQAQELWQRRRTPSAAAWLALARLWVRNADRERFGDTELPVRDSVAGLGAKA